MEARLVAGLDALLTRSCIRTGAAGDAVGMFCSGVVRRRCPPQCVKRFLVIVDSICSSTTQNGITRILSGSLADSLDMYIKDM